MVSLFFIIDQAADVNTLCGRVRLKMHDHAIIFHQTFAKISIYLEKGVWNDLEEKQLQHRI